jgi:hypothetical protein
MYDLLSAIIGFDNSESMGGYAEPKKEKVQEKKQSDKDILENIDATNLIEPSTKQAYKKKLLQIQKVFFNDKKSLYWILSNPEAIYEELKKYVKETRGRFDKTISVHTQRAYLTYPYSILKFRNRDILEEHPDLENRYKKILEVLNEPIMDIYVNGNALDKETDAYVPYNKLCEVRDSLKSSPVKLLLSLYTMIPPVRSNYESVRIYANDERPEDEEKNNYLIVTSKNQCKLVLNEYKTSKKNGQIVVNLPDCLCKEILESLNTNPRNYLFETKGEPYTSTNFNKWANTHLHKLFNNKFSLTSFRHIYITDCVPKLELDEKKLVSQIMGHSLNMQKGYDLKPKE